MVLADNSVMLDYRLGMGLEKTVISTAYRISVIYRPKV